jgi:uncharacterized DUF497 family protein
MPPELEWDEAKNPANRSKHDIGFEEAGAIFYGPVFTAPDRREGYGGRGSSASAGSRGLR